MSSERIPIVDQDEPGKYSRFSETTATSEEPEMEPVAAEIATTTPSESNATIILPESLELRRALFFKKEEYLKRFQKAIGVHAEEAQLTDLKYKLAVVDRLLTRGTVDVIQLAKDLNAQEAEEGKLLNKKLYTNAVLVIEHYARGRENTGGTGLDLTAGVGTDFDPDKRELKDGTVSMPSISRDEAIRRSEVNLDDLDTRPANRNPDGTIKALSKPKPLSREMEEKLASVKRPEKDRGGWSRIKRTISFGFWK
ncbi:MAG: hypothetical protein JWN18_432 [Parcubacteria group bacterium]|nr:hypothetical protein [Parcubacteria group bacterium]